MSTTARRAGRPPDADPEATRRAIREVALAHFGAYGYSQATIGNIARDAGLTSGAVHYHFASKEKLLEEISATVIEANATRLRAAAAQHTSFVARTAALFDELAAVHHETPDLGRFILVLVSDVARYPELRGAYDANVTAHHDLCSWLVDDALAAGELSATADRDGVVDMITGTISGLSSLMVMLPRSHHDSIALGVKLLFAGGLFTPTSAGR